MEAQKRVYITDSPGAADKKVHFVDSPAQADYYVEVVDFSRRDESVFPCGNGECDYRAYRVNR